MENEKLDGAELLTEKNGEGELTAENETFEADDAAAVQVPEYEPKNNFEKHLYRVYKDENLTEMLRISSLAIVALTVYSFLSALFVIFSESPFMALELLLITGVPFAAVSAARRLVNAPRPYELLEFYEKKPKAKSGSSFPSRHVFSVFVIGTALIVENAFLGAALLILGAVLAIIRVLMGIHFVRDVVAGGVIGIVSGVIGLVFLYLI